MLRAIRCSRTRPFRNPTPKNRSGLSVARFAPKSEAPIVLGDQPPPSLKLTVKVTAPMLAQSGRRSHPVAALVPMLAFHHRVPKAHHEAALLNRRHHHRFQRACSVVIKM